MYILSTYYIAFMLCVSISLCKKHFIIETKEPDQDDIRTEDELYNGGSSGDYGGFYDCAGALTVRCYDTRNSTIMENSCTFM